MNYIKEICELEMNIIIPGEMWEETFKSWCRLTKSQTQSEAEGQNQVF